MHNTRSATGSGGHAERPQWLALPVNHGDKTRMDPIAGLHNAARHCCIARIAHWRKTYSKLAEAQSDLATIEAGESEYTHEALDTFPRHNLLEAILSDVERFIPGDFSSLNEALELLVAAGETAENRATVPFRPIADAAIADERRRFVEYISKVTEHECALLPQFAVPTRPDRLRNPATSFRARRHLGKLVWRLW